MPSSQVPEILPTHSADHPLANSLSSSQSTIKWLGEISSNEGLHNPERKRVTRACIRCRKRKIRCSGGTPCMSCTNAPQQCECEYDQRRSSLEKGTANGCTKNTHNINHESFEQGLLTFPLDQNERGAQNSTPQQHLPRSNVAPSMAPSLAIDPSGPPRLSELHLHAHSLGCGCHDGSPACDQNITRQPRDQQLFADCEAGRNGPSKLRAQDLGQLETGDTEHPHRKSCLKPRHVLGNTENHTKVKKGGDEGKNLNTACLAHGKPKIVDKMISVSGDGIKIKTLKQRRRMLRNRQSASRQRKRLHAKNLVHLNNQYVATIAHLKADLQWKQLAPQVELNRELLEQISAEKETMGRKHNTEMILVREDIGALIDTIQGLVNILRHNGMACTIQLPPTPPGGLEENNGESSQILNPGSPVERSSV
ncbi:hypothetical protein F5883DRAFT_589294 [Diaporthe sp. PMI_573]|nr:hypothetical protein F5883DRAFT_589294 [Diaporthaceae sp. PMI_573]